MICLTIPVRIISCNATNYYKYMYLICAVDDETEIWPLEPMGVYDDQCCPLSLGSSSVSVPNGCGSATIPSQEVTAKEQTWEQMNNLTGAARKPEAFIGRVLVFVTVNAWLILPLSMQSEGNSKTFEGGNFTLRCSQSDFGIVKYLVCRVYF